MSPPHWFLGKGQGPLRDGRPSFEEELAKMPPMADSCYRRRDDWARVAQKWEADWLRDQLRQAKLESDGWSAAKREAMRFDRIRTDVIHPLPEPDEPSPD